MARSRTYLVSALAVVAATTAALAQTQTVGLFVNQPSSFPGYTLFPPLNAKQTYLIDNDGRPVHSWSSPYKAGLSAYLLENGHLLRGASLAPGVDPHWTTAAGGGGRIEEYDWDGNLVWSYDYSSDLHLQHHDLKLLPNGNVVFIAWTYKTAAEAIAAGRDPSRIAAGALWPESLVEVQPIRPSGGQIVWEWHAWDHLIQDFDASKANFGTVLDHPELVDINALSTNGELDWLHFNGVSYNADLDQLVISVHRFSEFWVIDHSTTTAQAASHAGGNSGKGGDLLYRWGNPIAYRRGVAADRKLFNQHDAQWIAPGSPGAGHFLVFNNGSNRPDGSYSSADEIVPPLNGGGTYDIAPGAAFGPAAPVWSYTSTPKTTFFSQIIGGVHRQPNGNTLITEGTRGNLFEVTSGSQVVWKYVNPVISTGPVNQGTVITGSPAQDNAVFKVKRYPADYPGLVGRTLVPGAPLELFQAPPPVPDGLGGTSPLRATRLDAAGTQIRTTWDATSCMATNYNLIFGNLASVATQTLAGAECAIGVTGSHTWSTVPAGDLFFLIVGTGQFPIYESSWGTDSAGRERHGTHPSGLCGVTTKSTTLTCP